MADTSEQNPYEEESIILESEVKAIIKLVERNKSQVTEMESVKILTRIC